MYLPEAISSEVRDLEHEIDEMGMSDSQVILFEHCVLKIEKNNEESDNEHRMIEWLKDRLPVPKILQSVQENGMNYLLMTRIHGEMACSEKLFDQPETLMDILVEGLKMLWRIEVKTCPSKNALDEKLESAKWRVANNLCSWDDAEPGTYGEDGFQSPAELLKWLNENRPEETLVFSHGDYCLPNVFVHEEKISGFVDLGRSGVADPYQDIALCYRSLLHNYEAVKPMHLDHELKIEAFFDKLGIKPDWDKIRYYILLDELF